MTEKLRTILAFKLKQYYGVFRVSTSAKLSTILAYLLIIFSSAGGALFIRLVYGMPRILNQSWIMDVMSIMFSSLFVFEIYLGMRGGITALKSEVDFVLTSPIKPSTYLTADLIFQLAFLNLIITPAMFAFMAVILYPNKNIILSLMAVYELVLLASIILSHMLGILGIRGYRRIVKFLGWSLMILMMAPVCFRILDINLPWMEFLHPSMMLSRLALLSPLGEDYLILFYLGIILGFYLRVVRETRIFSDITPILTTGFMELKSKASFYNLPPIVKKVMSIDADKHPLPFYMTKLNLIRIWRDGSMYASILFLLVFIMANLGFSSITGNVFKPEFASSTLTILYIPLIPALLTINWNIVERSSLWSAACSPHGLRRCLDGMLVAYILVSALFATCFYGLTYMVVGGSPFALTDLLLLINTSITSSALSILTALKLWRQSTSLSHTTLLHISIPMTGAILLDIPILIVRASGSLSSGLLIGVIGYSLTLLILLRKCVMMSIKDLMVTL